MKNHRGTKHTTADQVSAQSKFSGKEQKQFHYSLAVLEGQPCAPTWPPKTHSESTAPPVPCSPSLLPHSTAMDHGNRLLGSAPARADTYWKS